LNKQWYKLDNAAQIYPPNVSRKWMSMYRIAAVLKEKIDPEALQAAAEDVLPRFPTMKVELRKGFFWYYLDDNNTKFEVSEETKYPCQMIRLINRSYLFRIMYQNYRVSLEAFHSLTDATGSFCFLNTLLHRYFKIKGKAVTGFDGCLDYQDIPNAEESEDSFFKAADFKHFEPRKEDKAWPMKMPKSETGVFWITHGVADLQSIKDAAKKYNTTAGPFLTAVCLYSLYLVKESQPHKKKNNRIKLSITADMRRFFDSKTLRNFAMYMNLGIDGNRKYSFEEVLEAVAAEYPSFNKEYCLGVVNANVHAQRNPLVRGLPLFLKVIALRISFRLWGERLCTTTFSNIGVIKAPPEFNEYIERYESVIGPQWRQCAGFSALSFGGKTVLTISARAKDPVLERIFYKTLASFGVDITLDSNRGI